MIQVRHLTKTIGARAVLDDVSFDVVSGRVTGLAGPNGAGKSTLLRCMLSIDTVDRGHVLFAGQPYTSLDRPASTVGALLDAAAAHPGRSGVDHLRWVAAAIGVDRRRITEVLETVGLSDAASARVRTYSLGMRQRLGLATALLGDPAYVLLDEPTNGLDPDGIRWLRDTARGLADDGRAVLVSSHLLSELASLADDLVVIGDGRLIAAEPVTDFVGRYAAPRVLVSTPDGTRAGQMLRARGVTVEVVDHVGASASGESTPQVQTLAVDGLGPKAVGRLFAEHGFAVYSLVDDSDRLETAFLAATARSQRFVAADVVGASASRAEAGRG